MKSNKKHIVLLTPGFAPSEAHDATIPALLEYVQGIHKYRPDWKLTILAFQYPYSKLPYTYWGFDVIPFNGSNKKWKKWMIHYQIEKRLKEIHTLTPIDTVHSAWYGECAMVANRFSKRFNVKHVCTLMGQDVLAGNHYFRKLANSQFPVIYLSEYQKQRAESSLLHHPPYTVHWGLENNQQMTTSKDADVVWVGSLNRVKNVDLLLQTISVCVEFYPQLRVNVIGEAIKNSDIELQEKICKIGLQNNVHYWGKLSRKEAFSQIERARILLHTSVFESYGMIFIESMVAGCHIVSTPVGIAAEHPQIKTAQNATDLAALILKLRTLPAPNYANIPHISTTISQYEQLYFE